MVIDGTPAIVLTFVLAILGYLGLTAVMLRSLWYPVPKRWWSVVVAVIFTHVVMVWMFRYDWQFELAVRNGYVGFVLFHTALLIMVGSSFVSERLMRVGIIIGFCVVSLGASGAVFRYEVVELYRIPVLGCAGFGILAMLARLVQRRKQAPAPSE